jgi:hypothetical protein
VPVGIVPANWGVTVAVNVTCCMYVELLFGDEDTTAVAVVACMTVTVPAT